MKGGSPFCLLQDYASDDSSEKDILSLIENLSPGINSHSVSDKAIQLDSARENKESEQKDDLGDVISESDKCLKGNEEKNANSVPVPYKVDEFGRYLRQGASDSDSYDSRHRRRMRRGRSWSRSRSPVDRRRSPWKRREKRREKRSRSRSWSPRIRRRSRTPTFRRAGELNGANKRREKGQSQTCLYFTTGKCKRGASCRYSHNGSDNSDRSRRHGSKQYSEVSPGLKNYSDDKVKRQEKEHNQLMEVHCLGEGNDGTFPQRKNDRSGEDHASQEGQSLNSGVRDSLSASGAAAEWPEKRMIQEELNSQEAVESHLPALVDGFPSQSVSGVDVPKSLGDTSLDVPVLDSAIKPPQTEPSSTMGCSSQACLSSTPMGQHILPGQFPSQSWTYKETSPLRSSAEIPHHPSQSQLPPPPPRLPSGSIPHVPLTSSMQLHHPHQLHLPPPPQFPQAGNVAHVAQISSVPSKYAPKECFRPYMFPYQQSNFTVPPTSSWSSLPVLPPPPPPPQQPHNAVVNSGIAAPAVTSQFQQSNLPPRNGSGALLGCYPTQMPIRSWVNEFQHQTYPPMQENYHALLHAEDFRFNTLPAGNPPAHAQRPVQNSSMHLQPPTDLRGDNLPPGELIKSSSQAHSYSQQQQLHASTDSCLNIPDKISSSHRSDFGGSRIPSYYNPYASTFEQPLSFKLSSNESRQDNSCGLSHPSFNQEGLGNLQPANTSSLPNSERTTGQVVAIASKDQYDPLSDSTEPSSSTFKNSDHFQMRGIGSDSNMLGFSVSNKPLDLAENNKKEVGTIVLALSPENDEFGETGDAEVGAVENGSPSDPIDSVDMNAGEVEIDQVKSSRKSKRSKDSRSMRVFKIALAGFVKEVLKPLWRQGNVSKEAFKTIVKKTVEKVSGAMKNHQIPKSKPNIDQYIDSSQHKLTKLIMGYVDKYVKA